MGSSVPSQQETKDQEEESRFVGCSREPQRAGHVLGQETLDLVPARPLRAQVCESRQEDSGRPSPAMPLCSNRPAHLCCSLSAGSPGSTVLPAATAHPQERLTYQTCGPSPILDAGGGGGALFLWPPWNWATLLCSYQGYCSCGSLWATLKMSNCQQV